MTQGTIRPGWRGQPGDIAFYNGRTWRCLGGTEWVDHSTLTPQPPTPPASAGRAPRGKTRYQTLTEELEELERTNPEVAKARQAMDELPDQFARMKRHQDAREEVAARVRQNWASALRPGDILHFAGMLLPIGAVSQYAPDPDWEPAIRITGTVDERVVQIDLEPDDMVTFERRRRAEK